MHTLAEEHNTDAPAPDPMQEEFCTGEWLVKPQVNQIQHLQSGESRHLEPRLAKLLCFLASHAQQVVDRDTLVSVLWPKVIVNENSLTRAVSELRKQLQCDTTKNSYIETIPKRGYRLKTTVDAAPSNTCDDHANAADLPFWMTRIPQPARHSGSLAFGLALVLATWLTFQQPSLNTGPSIQLADELIPSHSNMLGASVTLSKSESNDSESIVADGIAEPVFASDEKRFAYVRYGHTGSTIYLGEVASDYDPVAIFNSQDVLFNLTWSPVGNSLLFASKPVLTTTALFDEPTAATLYALNLDSLELNVLVEQAPTTKNGGALDLSLT